MSQLRSSRRDSQNMHAVPRWVHDDEVAHCGTCGQEFGVATWKHHCRRCGRIVCDDCSKAKLLVPADEVVIPPEARMALAEFDFREPQRVCRDCEIGLLMRQDELQQTLAHAATSTQIDRGSIHRYLNAPVSFSLKEEIVKATHILLNFTSDNAIEGADSIPHDLIAEARGLAFITFIKAGLLFSGRVGSGLVVARRPNGGWSPPSAIGSGGVGWGFQLGGEVTDMMIILNTWGAVEAFSGKGQVALGTELSVSLGPLGRTASTDVRAGDGGVTAAFSYAHSKGFFIGVSLEATTVVSRPDANRDFYGREVSAKELLLAYNVDPPKAADPLYNALAEIERGIHRGAGGVWAGRGSGAGQDPRWSMADAPPHPAAPPDGSWDKQAREDYEFAARLQQEEYQAARGYPQDVTATAPAPETDYFSAAFGADRFHTANDSHAKPTPPRPPEGQEESLLQKMGSFLGIRDDTDVPRRGSGSRPVRSESGRGNGATGDSWVRDRQSRLQKARTELDEMMGPQANELGEIREAGPSASALYSNPHQDPSYTSDQAYEGDSSDDDEYVQQIVQFAGSRPRPG